MEDAASGNPVGPSSRDFGTYVNTHKQSSLVACGRSLFFRSAAFLLWQVFLAVIGQLQSMFHKYLLVGDENTLVRYYHYYLLITQYVKYISGVIPLIFSSKCSLP